MAAPDLTSAFTNAASGLFSMDNWHKFLGAAVGYFASSNFLGGGFFKNLTLAVAGWHASDALKNNLSIEGIMDFGRNLIGGGTGNAPAPAAH